MARKQSVLTNISLKKSKTIPVSNPIILKRGNLWQKIQKNSEYLNYSNVSCRSLKAMTESCLWDYLSKNKFNVLVDIRTVLNLSHIFLTLSS